MEDCNWHETGSEVTKYKLASADERTGVGNGNHRGVIVVKFDAYSEQRDRQNANRPEGPDLSAMSNRQLRIRVEAVMEALFNPSVLPPRAANMAVINFPWFPRAPSAAALAATATQAQVATIPRLDVAFNLMGSSAELGFGFDNAAEQIMGTVVA
ncbi:hypothetical protein HYFRA_00003957 [Hymenoscyphus fraxineus]|uniref:Uncharacterized protein n=1 Tax=Hymenoscyphus fraxineus TaxID=746836 RepID=A0A9N9L1I4_9HELO|nr:hypothetical protein HYFRA_00003957 [Hymenoscyphus fraxineus]